MSHCTVKWPYCLLVYLYVKQKLNLIYLYFQNIYIQICDVLCGFFCMICFSIFVETSYISYYYNGFRALLTLMSSMIKTYMI